MVEDLQPSGEIASTWHKELIRLGYKWFYVIPEKYVLLGDRLFRIVIHYYRYDRMMDIAERKVKRG